MNNSFYNDFAACFAASTLTSLVESFNSQVGNRGFNSVSKTIDDAVCSWHHRLSFLYCDGRQPYSSLNNLANCFGDKPML